MAGKPVGRPTGNGGLDGAQGRPVASDLGQANTGVELAHLTQHGCCGVGREFLGHSSRAHPEGRTRSPAKKPLQKPRGASGEVGKPMEQRTLDRLNTSRLRPRPEDFTCAASMRRTKGRRETAWRDAHMVTWGRLEQRETLRRACAPNRRAALRRPETCSHCRVWSQPDDGGS
jgi:hypothetical protein